MMITNDNIMDFNLADTKDVGKNPAPFLTKETLRVIPYAPFNVTMVIPDVSVFMLVILAKLFYILSFPPNNLNQNPDVPNQHPDVLSQHPHVLNQHPDALSQHPDVLSQHPHVLNRHPDVLSRHPDVLSQHPDVLNQHPDVLNRHPDVPSQHPHVPSQHPDVLNQHPHDLNYKISGAAGVVYFEIASSNYHRTYCFSFVTITIIIFAYRQLVKKQKTNLKKEKVSWH